MSDDSGRGYPGDDPFVDAGDPEAVERAERRREREEKRASKAAKKKQKATASPPPPRPREEPPTKPRTPEQEFWDDPAEPVTPPPGEAPTVAPKPDPEAAERGRRRLLGRRRKKAAATGAAGAAAAGGTIAASDADAAGAAGAPPTGESLAAKAPPPPSGESPSPKDAAATTSEPPATQPAGPSRTEDPVAPSGPPTTEQPAARPGTTTTEQPMPKDPDKSSGPPTGEEPRPGGPDTGEAQRPVGPVTDEHARPDPGRATAAAPRQDPNQPTASNALPDEADGPSRGARVPPPRPLDEAGAGDWEPPPPRDDDWFDEDFHDEGDPRMAGAARHGRRHGDDGGRRGGFFGALLRHPFRILGVVVLIVILLFLNALFQPFHGDGHGKVAVVIPKGSSVGEVGDLLEKKGVISGGFIVPGSTLFQARVTLDGKRSDLFAGKFTMAKDMSYGSVIDQLSKEPKPQEAASKPGIVTVTIPEGQSRPITAKLLKEDGVKGNYMIATRKSKILNPEKYGGKNVKNLEGFLFPDTWEYKTKQPVSHLVALQLQDFKKKIKKVNMKYAKSKNLTVFDVVTIASMVEREAGVPKQRKLVASVIYNRLHEGMTLGIDSTIRFATGNYEQPLTQSELESESPYNTRTHAGLPPGPINSPGLAALQAAAHPAKTDFLFYVNNPNSCNELTFAKTEDEFFADAAKYEKAREANGGNQPSTCK